jgi:mannan endo-1,4-beta-mannosidase
MRKVLILSCLLILTSGALNCFFIAAADTVVTFTVDPRLERAAISPYIYGTCFDLTGTEGWTARRLGGNRMTGYNWENNASNAGSDWQHHSDNYMADNVGVPEAEADHPGATLVYFHNKSLSMNVPYSLITLQMAGYVAKDKNGPVLESEVAPSARWAQVKNLKKTPFTISPNLNDDYVYMDEEVNFLVRRFGKACRRTGIKGYALDNEPALWPSTHSRIHPDKTGCAELVNKSVDLAKAVKSVDPSADIFGLVGYGFMEPLSLQDAPDWETEKGSYDWFLDYYLDKMKLASDAAGQRLLDVLDMHWYPEARGGGARIVFEDSTANLECAKARIQAPRTLWDPTYTEDSWIAQWFKSYLPLIPRLQSSIDAYYPGTKMAITEYSYGGEDHISGGIAMADALGAFGKYGVYLAAYWKSMEDTDYVTAAVKLYRNYDGNKSAYGDTKVKADTSDPVNSSVYASIVRGNAQQLHLIVMNKNFDTELTANFVLKGYKKYTSGKVWAFDSGSAEITERTAIKSIVKNSFSYTIPPLTVCHIVLK